MYFFTTFSMCTLCRSKSSISLDSTYFPHRPRTHSNARCPTLIQTTKDWKLQTRNKKTSTFLFLSSISQTSPRGRLESLDSGVEGMEFSERMGDLGMDSSDRMDDLLPDLGLLTSDDCTSLGTPGPNDPPAGQYTLYTKDVYGCGYAL